MTLTNLYSKTHIIVVGTGGIGGLYGSLLKQPNVHLTFIARSDYKTIKKFGIQLQSIWGDRHIQPDFAIDANTDTPHYPYKPDYIILTTKTTHIADQVKIIQPYVTDSTTIVLIQNGFEIEAPYQKAFPQAPIMRGLAFVCTTRIAPGVIHHQDYGPLSLGMVTNTTNITNIIDSPHPFPTQKKTATTPTESKQTSPADRLCALFNNANTPKAFCNVSANIQTDIWKKLVWNVPFNPLSVIHKTTTKTLLADPKITAQIRAIMTEVVTIAKAAGVHLDDTLVDTMIQNTLKMNPYKTSMLLDYERGRPIEQDAILKQLLSFAKRHNLATPQIDRLDEALSAIATEK